MITDKMKQLAKSDTITCFIGDNCVSYRTINLSSIGKTIKLLDMLSKKGVNTNKILEYEIDNDSVCSIIDFERYQDGWILSTKLEGNPIHDDITYIRQTDDISAVDLLARYYEALRTYSRNIAMYANAKQEVIDKLVLDFFTIYKSDLMLDVNVNNVLFDGKSFGFINLYYSDGAKNKLISFIRSLLDLVIFQPPYILLNDGTIIDDIPNEMYSSLSTNIKLLLDKLIEALSKLPISSFKVEKDVINYLVTKENLIHGGISQDDLLSKISSKKKEYC